MPRDGEGKPAGILGLYAQAPAVRVAEDQVLPPLDDGTDDCVDVRRLGGSRLSQNRIVALVTLALVFAGSAVVEHLAMALAVRRFLPALNPAPWRTNREALRLVRGYSVDALLAMLAGRISFKTDAIVIGLCGQLDLIPFFDMPARLVEYAKNLIRSATTTLTPAVSALEAKGGQDAIRRRGDRPSSVPLSFD